MDRLNAGLCPLLLVTGQRLQAVSQMRRANLSWTEDDCTIRYSRTMKSNDPARNPLVLHLKKYQVQEICMFLHLKEYLGRVDLQGVGESAFVTTRPPHVQASQDTFIRYVGSRSMRRAL